MRGWVYIIGGAVVIAIGGVLATLGWFQLDAWKRDEKSRHKGQHFKGWCLVLLGSAIIGVGGVIVPFGWSMMDDWGKMQNLYHGVVREWEMNTSLLKNDPGFNTKDLETLRSHRLFPKLRNTACGNLLNSGLFSSNSQTEKDFLVQIADYEEAVRDINSRLDVSNNYIVSTIDTEKVKQHRMTVLTSRGYRSFLDVHESLKKQLLQTYPTWFEEGKFLFKARKNN